MKFNNLVVRVGIVSFALAASGCTGGTAKCNDDYSKKEVLSVIQSNLKFSASLLKNGRLNKSQLIGVRTTGHDGTLDTYMCEATYKFELDEEPKEFPVRYELSYMEDEKRTRVAVYGIRNIDDGILGSQMFKSFLK